MSDPYVPGPSVAPRSAAERAYGLLRDRLTDGTYKAGQPLLVDRVRVELGVSKQPVMEALRRLSAEGFVRITPQVGCHVMQHDFAEVRDYFVLFAAVEAAAAGLAAERRSRELLATAEAVSAQIGRLSEDAAAPLQERARGYFLLNRQLHSLIHQMSGTPIVETFASGMYARADFFIYGGAAETPLAPALPQRHADHVRLLRAIAEQDAEAARAAATEHILGTVELLAAAERLPQH